MVEFDWRKLLCKKRPRKDGLVQEDTIGRSSLVRSCFAQDYGRVVFSPPFRRLAKKTQVHPFSNIDFIHNRLTHSVEVASLGQTFGLSLARFLRERNALTNDILDADIAYILSSACSAHDIGNPPFGHAGEEAIRAWAEKTDWSSLGAANPIDWLSYDGNAQTFRMLSNPQPRDSAYFRLTCATCGTVVKYPWVMGSGTKKGKAGCFAYKEDAQLFDDVMSSLGLKNGAENKYFRHPLSYLLEAADDICYQVMDVEDAVTMHIIEEGRIKKLLSDLTNESLSYPIQHLRGKAIHRLCEAAFRAFTKNYKKIMRGKFNGDIVTCNEFELKDQFNALKQEYNQIFSTRSKVAVEVSCYEIMDKLLTRYSRFALNLCTAKSIDDVRSSDLKLLDFTWGKEYGAKLIAEHAGDFMWWMHAVTDHIVGMTDDYARSTAMMF